jgi:peptide-methionine (S)-S-oxide reductase
VLLLVMLGGDTDNPTYEKVCSGKTNHAEVIKIIFDPLIISLEKILEIFWVIHDPTTLNQQGADIGTQYRSVIFYHNQAQKNKILQSKERLEKSHIYSQPIVTEINQLPIFYQAEDNHKNYYNQNRSSSYCRLVIDPKIAKLYTSTNQDLIIQ